MQQPNFIHNELSKGTFWILHEMTERYKILDITIKITINDDKLGHFHSRCNFAHLHKATGTTTIGHYCLIPPPLQLKLVSAGCKLEARNVSGACSVQFECQTEVHQSGCSIRCVIANQPTSCGGFVSHQTQSESSRSYSKLVTAKD